MKGIVFTEFLDHVESQHGVLFLEDLVMECEAEMKGAYTRVGTYPCSELVQLITLLSSRTGKAVPEVIVAFGEQLAESFERDYPIYFEQEDYFDFVECVEQRIHRDVLKLYPDAELPRFTTIERTPKKLVIDYVSSRSLEHLALGLLRGIAEKYDETVAIGMQEFHSNENRVVRFEIVRP